MKGTEKQIAWATQIQKTVIDTANEVYNIMVNDSKYDKNNEQHVNMAEIYKSWSELAEKEENASFFIEYFSRINASDALMQRVRAIRTAIIVNPMPQEWRVK